jgi:hypothetical protein
MNCGKGRTTIIATREYQDGKLVFRKVEIVRTVDRNPSEGDTRFPVQGIGKDIRWPVEKGDQG